MNQPPRKVRPPAWRRPRGVTEGVWDYVHQRSIADHYDAFVAGTPLCTLDEQVVHQELERAGGERTERVLDLGCGNGRVALGLLHRGNEVIGVDLSERMLELMLEKAAAAGVADRVLALRANLVELTCLAPASVDHAVCMFSTLGMIHGRGHRREVLAHARRAVRPGGRLILHVHHRWAALWEPRGIRGLLMSRLRSLVQPQHDFGDTVYAYRGLSDMFLHRFSRSEIHADLRASGWELERTLAISLDGSRIIESGLERQFRSGGFFLIAQRPRTEVPSA